jgi:tetratricopeptide (TPR) repeat protein
LPTIFNNIGELYRYSGDFYNSESYYLDALIIAEDLNKHNDIIESWKFLGTLMLHQNKISEARSFFIQAIKLAQEKVSQLELLALIHRSFPSLTLDEKTTYSQLDFTSKGDIFNETSSLLLKSIMLSYTVSNQDKLDVDIIRVVFQEIMDLVKEVDPGDPFDLPIETMLLVANKLKVQSEIELANNYLNDVFQLIGDKKYMLNARISSLIDTIKN